MKTKVFFLFIVYFLVTNGLNAQSRLYKFLVNQTGFKTKDVQSAGIFYAPKGATFEIIEETQEEFIVRFKEVPTTPTNAKVYLSETFIITELPEIQKVQIDVNYKIEISNLPRYNYKLLFGFDWGALAVPFKLQTFDGTLSAGSSIGPYIGWKQRWLLGVPSTILVAAGLSIIPTQDINTENVNTKAGLTGAVGLVFTPIPQLQIGLITGVDHLGGAAGKNYPYEDKFWLSFAIGFGFTK